MIPPSPPKRNIHHRALPRHPARQPRALSSRLTSGAYAQAAFRRTARNRVPATLYPVKTSGAGRPSSRNMPRLFHGLRTAQHLPQSARDSACAPPGRSGCLRLPGISFCSRSIAVVVIESPNKLPDHCQRLPHRVLWIASPKILAAQQERQAGVTNWEHVFTTCAHGVHSL